MKKQFNIFIFFLLPFMLLAGGCKKYLEAKPDQKLATINSLADMQSLIDNDYWVNNYDPVSSEECADNYYLPAASWQSLFEDVDRNRYIWESNAFTVANLFNDWTWTYDNVYTANTIITNIGKVPAGASRDNLEGQAWFLRGRCYLKAAEIWGKAYDPATAATDLGIVLRNGVDFKAVSVRATNAESWAQVISDLKRAAALLPVTPAHVLRASKPAAYGLLSRAYLDMGDFANAKAYADSCLALKNVLVDFKTLNPANFYPLPQFNGEVIYVSGLSISNILYSGIALMDPDLIQQYSDNDLRKSIYFNRLTDGNYQFRGNFNGSYLLFSGVTTGELLLTRAECSARLGNAQAAMDDLNLLLSRRFSVYVPQTAPDAAAALQLVLTERRKELVMRGSRFADIKRLNKLGANISIVRNLDKVYTLPPNDNRFALPIPDNVITLSGIPQNPR